MTTCKNCNKQLCRRPGRNKSGYCKGCAQKCAPHVELPKHKKTCLSCGETFLAKRTRKMFCSGRCVKAKDSSRHLHPELYRGSHPLLKTKGNKPRKGQVVACYYCGVEKYVKPCHLSAKRFFCSREHRILFEKKNAFHFQCVTCKKAVYVQPIQVKTRNRRTCSRICSNVIKRKEAEERRIRLGYTKHQLDRLARYSPEATEWRKAVFARDDYICQICKIRGGYLEADHIKPFAYFPALRFELSNGRTLCRPCHDKTKISAKRMREIYSDELYEKKIEELL